MKNYVVDNYENYQEENRLTTNNARRIEYVTTVRVMDELIGNDSDILDCAAGTRRNFRSGVIIITAYAGRSPCLERATM